MCTVHQDNSAPLLNQEPYAFHMLKLKQFGHHSFSFAAASVWNSMPCEIRSIQFTTAFKATRKTRLLAN